MSGSHQGEPDLWAVFASLRQVRTVDTHSELLSGWGRATASMATVVAADSDQVPEVLGEVGTRGAIARGCGRSYGDPATNSGGHVIELRRTPVDPMTPAIELVDLGSPVSSSPSMLGLRVGAGLTIAQVLDFLVPRGYFVPVTPGTRQVTIGGAIASDIHGKNHHLDGSFGHHVHRLRLTTANGTERVVSPHDDPDLFWATVGGMGLTGIITEAVIGVMPIETSRIVVESRRFNDLDALMASMVESDANFRYSVAWLDVLARGASVGRGVLTNGHHAGIAELSPNDRRDPLYYAPEYRLTMPPIMPKAGMINRATVAGFNEMWFRRVSPRTSRAIESIPTYFHPLDAVGKWNRIYGRGGLVQYQVVVPHHSAELVRTIVAALSAARLPSFLTVLKRFGPGNPGMLSFPMAGWTLAVDLAASAPGLGHVLAGLDEQVIEVGGRHYLAKDHLLGPSQIRASYPRLAEWQQIQRSVDPAGRWQSDQSRRLQLTTPHRTMQTLRTPS